MVDLSVFGRQKTLVDQQQLQAAFDMKKQLALTAAQAQIQKASSPANVQEYQYFSQLPPQQQAEYLNVKRASQVLNLGNEMAIRTPSGGISETYAVNVNPNNAPELKGLQQDAVNKSKLNVASPLAAATTAGKMEGEAIGTLNKKSVQANDVLSILNEADPYLNKATGSGIGATVAAGKQIFGKSDESTQANAALQVLGGRLVSSIPRMEGPQSDADVRLYREQAAKLADPTVPAADKRSAINALRTLNQKYATGGNSQSNRQGNVTIRMGQVEDGYQFVGGNPADPSSWKKVQ